MKTLQKLGSARSRPSHPPGLRGLLVLGLLCLSAFSPTGANAEVAVDGDRDQMRVSVDNDTVGRALQALGQKEKLQFHSATPLNKVIGGSFSGSLDTSYPAFSSVSILSCVTARRRRDFRLRRERRKGRPAGPADGRFAAASTSLATGPTAAVGLNATPRNAVPQATSP